MPRRAARSCAPEREAMSCPASMICPEVGRSSSVKQRSSVDFPAPDMPMMP